MNAVDLVRTAVRNTFRAKLRTSLTVLAIVIGAFTLTLTSGVGTGISSYIRTQVSSLGSSDTLTVTKAAQATTGTGDGPQRWTPDSVATSQLQGPPGSNLALTAKDVTAIRGTAGITGVTENRAIAASWIEYGDHGKYQVVVASTATTKADLAAGAQLDQSASGYQVLLPTSYLHALGIGTAKDAVGRTVAIGIKDYTGVLHTVEATVVGVQNTSLFVSGVSADEALRARLIALQTTGTPSRVATTYSSVTATFAAGATAADVSAIKQRLSDAGYAGRTTDDQLGSILTVIDAIVGVLNAFAVIALIAAGFGIVNTLLMSVAERTREIGLMKAMGMGSGRVFALFSLEAVVIGFLGSAIGAGVAIALGLVLSSVLAGGLLSALPGLHLLQFTVPGVLTIVLAVMLIGFLAGTLPARRAARQNPIDALRYE